jgi:hypothetical protein
MVTPHHVILRGVLSTRLVVENGITLCIPHHNTVQEEIPKKGGLYDYGMELLIGRTLLATLKRMSGVRPAKRRITSVLQAIEDINGKPSTQSREHMKKGSESRYSKLRREQGSP